jgi:hypothetical protein
MRLRIGKYTISIVNMSFSDDCGVWNIDDKGKHYYKSLEFVFRIWSKNGFTYKKWVSIPYRFQRISEMDRLEKWKKEDSEG